MTPAESLNVTTQLIETPGRLVAVDGQVNVADADEVVAYAKGLVPFVFEAVSGGETTDQLLIRLPEHGVLVAQDLVYHHTNSFVGNNDIARWQVILQELADSAYDTILPGHGLPAGPAVFAEMIEYLDAARELPGDDGQAYKQAIIERFPRTRFPS